MARGWAEADSKVVRSARRSKRFSFGWIFNLGRRTITSRFGFAELRVQLKPDGTPDFDRLVVGEAPNINAVVWGEKDGEIVVAVVVQARPFADNPDGTPADPSIIFGQPCVMGFNLERVAGADAATREASEEAGTGSAVIADPEKLGHTNPNPTFCATWSEVLGLQVDPTKVTSQVDRSELIYRAEYLTVQELMWRIAQGTHKGVNYRSSQAIAAFSVWLFSHPEILRRAAKSYGRR